MSGPATALTSLTTERAPAADDTTAGHTVLGADGYESGSSVRKTPTGIPGLDHVAMGGLPERRATVLAGPAGSAKTVLSSQFLAEGIVRGKPGVFVTLEESADDLRTNLATLGFDVTAWERAGDWRFVDASPALSNEAPPRPSMDTLVAQIGHAVDATGADRLVLDSLNTVLTLDGDVAGARQQLRLLVTRLRAMGLTVLLTVETREDAEGSLSRLEIEEFVADNVILLRNAREGAFRRRTLEVLKMRGAMHHKGEVAFTVLPGRGVVVLPVMPPEQDVNVRDERVGTGNAGLDEMTGGGLFRGSSLLVTGPSGAGKTLIATQFAAEGLDRGEKVLFVSYEETLEQVHRNARGWGYDFGAHQDAGLLRLKATYPEVASLDDHLVELTEQIERGQPDRLVVDSLSALERLGSAAAFRAFVIGVTSAVKQLGLATLLTSSSNDPYGAASSAASHISGLIDSIVTLRTTEDTGVLTRGLHVLKVRGSAHAMNVHEFTVDGTGMVLHGGPAQS